MARVLSSCAKQFCQFYRFAVLVSTQETRSSAQGNCSAKSLAGDVTDSSLSSPRGGGGPVEGGGSSVGVGEGRGRVGGGGLGRGRGRGQGTFHLPCHILHYHMVLRPEGTPAQQTKNRY